MSGYVEARLILITAGVGPGKELWGNGNVWGAFLTSSGLEG